MPNAPGRENGTRETTTSHPASESFEENSINVRIDGRLGDKLNIFGRYSLGDFFRDGPDVVRTGRRAGAGQPWRRLGRAQSQPRLRHGLHHVADDARGLPVRVLPLQGKRAAVRLRNHAGGRRGDSRAEHRQHVRVRAACRLHRRRQLDRARRLRVRIGARRQPVQLPAGPEREAVADGRQPDQAIRQSQLQVRHRRQACLQPARAERCAPLGRTDVFERPHVAQRRGRPRAGDIPDRRRHAAAPLRQRQHRRARAPVAPLLLRAGHLAREQQGDDQLRVAARHHQPAVDQRCRERGIPRSEHRGNRRSRRR